MEVYVQEIKENKDNVWGVTPKERCEKIVSKEEIGRQRSD